MTVNTISNTLIAKETILKYLKPYNNGDNDASAAMQPNTNIVLLNFLEFLNKTIIDNSIKAQVIIAVISGPKTA